MKLLSLEIKREQWGPNKGQYTSKVVVDDDTSSIHLTLPPDITNRVLKVCIGQLTDAVDRAAQDLRERLVASVNHVPLMLEASPDTPP